MDRLFEVKRQRLAYLELWRESAVRPQRDVCVKEDLDLLSRDKDDLDALEKRCDAAREDMNQALPLHITKYDIYDLVPAKSGIDGSGKGLFYMPSSQSDVLREGEIVSYYYGNIHNFRSSKRLKDTSYLMLVEGDILVDPEPLAHIFARYINDPINDFFYNCRFEPDPKAYRSRVVATRDILAGEEIFAPYGEFYWSQQAYDPTILRQPEANK